MCCLSPGSAPSVNERHAALLGLRAFVLTSPYDVPAWLTDVLMALVRAAAEPAPIKKTVRHSHLSRLLKQEFLCNTCIVEFCALLVSE
jgi:hypothetical protein